MQGYNASFARVYNRRWASFAQQIAPRIQQFYDSTPIAQHSTQVLDLGCGAGHLAQYFLDHGYEVTGMDLSPAMLAYARANTAPYLLTGQARFIEGDAASFTLDQQFGMVVSTFDALNHLPDFQSLRSCFSSVYPALLPDGWFLFDLNTRQGLRRWTSITVEDTPELTLIVRSLFDEAAGKGYLHASGYLPTENGLYERFEETAYNTAFDLQMVQAALLEAGFGSVRFTRSSDLHAVVEDPEAENRVMIIAGK